QRCGRAVRRAERRLHLIRDVEQLGLALGTQGDLAHPVILRPVPSAPPRPQELESYREEADRFIAELDEEYYLHFAGLKDRLELEEIYERHASLTELERVQAIGSAVDGETIPYRMIRPELANEADRDRRERLDRAMWEATEEHLNPVYAEAVEITRE